MNDGMRFVGNDLFSRARRLASILWLAAIVILALFSHSAQGEESTNTNVQYSSRAWLMEEGLPQNAVQALTQTRDGYLWVGTLKGLSRFDGAQFTVFNPQNTPGLKSSSISALCESSDGSLWIGTSGGGLTVFRDGIFTFFGPSNETRGNTVRTILQTHDGSLWVGTLDGLFRWQNGNWSHFTQKDGLCTNVVRSLCEVDGGVMIGTAGGVNVWRKGVIAMENSFADKSVRVIFQDSQSNLWVGLSEGLYCLKNGELTLYQKKDGLADNYITTLFEDRRGQLWVGTYGGLSRWVNGKFIVEKDSQGSFYDQVNAITEDAEGDMWIGARDGLQQLRIKRFTTYTRQQGLAHNNIMSVLEDKKGNVWISTWGGGLSQLQGDKIINHTSENGDSNGLTSNLILALYEDRDGSLLIGTDYEGGTFRLADGEFSRVWSQEQALMDRVVRVIYRDREGDLWFGASPGLILWNKNERLMETNVIRCILEDHSGTLWVGANDGLYYCTNGQFVNWTAQQNLSHRTIISLYEDAENNLWIGTGGRGLSRYRDGQLTTYTTKQGMFSDEMFEILEDDHGWLWISCSRGIYRVSKQNLEACGKNGTPITCIAYDKADGMETAQCNGIAKPSGWKGRDGRLWFATAKGLTVTDPSQDLTVNDKPPAVLIEEVIADKHSFAVRAANRHARISPQKLQIPPGHGDLEFHYTALSLQAPEKNLFKYKLEGVDSDWTEVTRRVAYYNNLAPGTYQFDVVACNNDGVWNKTGAAVAIILLPHFWQTWWFKGAIVFLAIAAAGGTVQQITRRNLQREVQRLEKQHAIEEERIRIARDMHDEIGAKLTKISFLGAVAKRKLALPEEAGPQIDKMSQTARDVIRALDEIVWAVNPANDSLEHLATYLCRNATEFFDNSPILCQFDIPDELPPCRLGTDVRHNILLAAKEAMNNILKHSGASTVAVKISVQPEVFEVTILDNGRGFDRQATAERTARIGNGLTNMEHRLNSIGGRCAVESGAGRGTKITFTVYLKGGVES
ncbi:MAG TPA: two-component regulator propeller domain-containing protein [Verrucomicrobiae bacterium]|jgi:ligand-binding sensor domain-containing protein/signal transduction histidine kinase|nr:two-component regulator propeller domain-containing protein [Verrucomicrobiae bacterium]